MSRPPGSTRQVAQEPSTACRSRPRAPTTKRRRRCAPASAGSPRANAAKALARGVLVHRLLQSLPDIPRAARAEAARRHLARAAGISAPRNARPDRAGAARARRSALLRAVLARQPRRGADRRAPHGRHACRLRPGRPPGRDRRCGADRRLQDQSPRAAAESTTCRRPTSASLRSTARCSASSTRTSPSAPR